MKVKHFLIIIGLIVVALVTTILVFFVFGNKKSNIEHAQVQQYMEENTATTLSKPIESATDVANIERYDGDGSKIDLQSSAIVETSNLNATGKYISNNIYDAQECAHLKDISDAYLHTLGYTEDFQYIYNKQNDIIIIEVLDADIVLTVIGDDDVYLTENSNVPIVYKCDVTIEQENLLQSYFLSKYDPYKIALYLLQNNESGIVYKTTNSDEAIEVSWDEIKEQIEEMLHDEAGDGDF